MVHTTGPQNHLIYHLLTFLWRSVKDEVLRATVRNGVQLKRRIARAVRSIQQETLRKAWKNLENRLHAIISEDGGHIEHL